MYHSNENRISFREYKTPVESRTATRKSKEYYPSLQKKEQKAEFIPDADDSACTAYSPNNEKPRA